MLLKQAIKTNKIVSILLIFILSASWVIAATATGGGVMGGGGGGSSSSSVWGSVSISSPAGSSSGEGPFFHGLKCSDTGQLTFKQKPAIKPVIVEKENGTKFTIAGDWEGSVFKSEEAEINQAGTYTIRDAKNGDKSVECPGLKFSCRTVELDIQEFFYENGKIMVAFTLNGEGTSVDKLLFQFKKMDSSYLLEYQKSKMVSPELKGIQLQSEENKGHILEITDAPPVSELKITYKGCVGKYYVSAKTDCLKKEELVTKVVKKPTQPAAEEVEERDEKPINNFKFILRETIFLFKKFFSS